jgi:hypothetical protein
VRHGRQAGVDTAYRWGDGRVAVNHRQAPFPIPAPGWHKGCNVPGATERFGASAGRADPLADLAIGPPSPGQPSAFVAAWPDSSSCSSPDSYISIMMSDPPTNSPAT